MSPKVLFLNSKYPFPESRLQDWCARHPEVHFVEKQDTQLDLEQVLEDHADAQILVTNYDPLTASRLIQLPQLHTIIAASTATEYIDKSYCSKHHITVHANVAYTGAAVAEHLMAMVFTLARKLRQLSPEAEVGLSLEDKLAFELEGKRVGVLGFGNIGQKFAALAYALGMEVVFYNRSEKISPFAQPCALEELLPTVDVLACTLPLNSQTRGLMDATHLRMLKERAMVVSISPDAVFDLPVLAQMLVEGSLYGVGLDLHAPHPGLFTQGNFVTTMTKAWLTTECLQRRLEGVLGILDRVLAQDT